eukprot:262313_1
MSATDLAEHRQRYKQLIFNKWSEFCGTDDFKSIINELAFNQYKFEIADISQKDEILKMMNESYNKQTWMPILISQTIQFNQSLINSIQNGRCIIIMKKTTDEIVGSTLIDDLLDHKNVGDLDKDKYLDAIDAAVHIKEIVTDCSRAVYEFVVNKIGDTSKLRYGLCLYQGGSCTKYGLNNIGFSFIYSLISYFAAEYIGYKMLCGDAVNTKMINIAKAFGAEIIDETNYQNYVFKDGTNINYYFDKLKSKNPNIDIEKFKKQCVTSGIFVSKKITINDYKMMAVMIKKRRNQRSKL